MCFQSFDLFLYFSKPIFSTLINKSLVCRPHIGDVDILAALRRLQLKCGNRGFKAIVLNLALEGIQLPNTF